jgi:N-acetyl-alpha-D-glucosaminyl L-malate synthase BshA
MKLAVVCYPTYGGSGVVATELARGLAQRGHEIHVVSYEAPFRFDFDQPNLHFHRVEVSNYPLFRDRPYSLNLANRIIELVEDHGVEVVHSHYAIPHAQAAWMAREVLREERGLDVKLACTLHGTDITLVGRERAFFEITRFSIQRQDLLTAPSDWLARETHREFHTTDHEIVVIPNFIDLDRFRPGDPEAVAATRRELGVDGGHLITHVSNFRPVKRVADVVSGFAALRSRSRAVLTLVGEGPELPAAEALAEKLGVRDDVRVLGKLDRLETVLQASDLFFLPSLAESFGLAALEAQACGCPVIGYRAGGLPEVVVDGETGVLCPEGEDVCMGSVAAELLADPDRYAEMRRAARRNAECFAAGPIVERYEKALCCLIHADLPCSAETVADCTHC